MLVGYCKEQWNKVDQLLPTESGQSVECVISVKYYMGNKDYGSVSAHSSMCFHSGIYIYIYIYKVQVIYI